jgi:hypothetical protein
VDKINRIETIGEAVDRLVTVPMSNWTILKGLPLMEIYQTARDKAGKPLTLAAAKLLKDAVTPGDHVFILSGFIIKSFMLAETDGPVGAASLARALDIGLGAVPIVLTEESITNTFAKTCSAAGLIVCDNEQLNTGGRGRKMMVRSFPVDHEAARKEAVRIIQQYRPKAVIAIERPGWNRKRVHHSGGGFDISEITAKLDYVFLEAQKRGITTIGIGDLGNEMGMGFVADAVRSKIPHAEKCLCPCEGGIACDISADIGIICNISNWGAYGVEACLAALTGELEVMHDADTERFMIRECVRAGGIDPVSGMLRPYVDGESEDINAYIVEMLRSIVRHATNESIFTKSYRETWSGKQNGK